MKRCLSSLCLVLSTGLVLAQGTVTFDNLDAPITNYLTGTPIGTGFSASFFYLPDLGFPPTYLDFSLSGVTLPPDAGLVDGKFWNETRTIPGPPGANAWFQARVWEIAFGPTFEAAVSNPNPIGGHLALAWYSEIQIARTGDPTSVPPVPSTRVSFHQWTLVPEPSTGALGVLGLALLWLVRRRG